MRPTRLAVMLVVASAAWATVPAGSAPAAFRCASARGETLLANEQARVYVTPSSGVRACAVGGRRSYFVERYLGRHRPDADDPYDSLSEEFGNLRLAGPWVMHTGAGCVKDLCGSFVKLRNLRTGRLRSGGEGLSTAGPFSAFEDAVVSPRGGVAFLARAATGTTTTKVLVRWDAAGEAVLAEGGPTALAAGASRVYWTDETGAPRSAPLAGAPAYRVPPARRAGR